MPIREYSCNDCDFRFESIDLGPAERPAHEEPACPNCGSRDVAKRISLFSSLRGEAPLGDKPASGRFG